MRVSRDAGEPVSRGRIDRRAVDAQALREALFGVALFAIIVTLNAIVAALLFGVMQALGLWTPATADATLISLDGADEMPARLHALVGRRHWATS